jgi:hypothetical protein
MFTNDMTSGSEGDFLGVSTDHEDDDNENQQPVHSATSHHSVGKSTVSYQTVSLTWLLTFIHSLMPVLRLDVKRYVFYVINHSILICVQRPSFINQSLDEEPEVTSLHYLNIVVVMLISLKLSAIESDASTHLRKKKRKQKVKAAHRDDPNYGWPEDAHYAPNEDGQEIGLKSQPRDLQMVIRRAIRMVIRETLSKTAYVEPEDLVPYLRKSMRAAALEFKFAALAGRFQTDPEFGSALSPLVCRPIPCFVC